MTTLAEEVLDEQLQETQPLVEDGEEKNFASQLPEPKGYKLLIALPEIEEKT